MPTYDVIVLRAGHMTKNWIVFKSTNINYIFIKIGKKIVGNNFKIST